MDPIISSRMNLESGSSSNSNSTRQNPAIRKRRNGLRPACEPCRKTKVRCDTDPPGSVCTRCKKRKSPSECIFLEAPMTRSYRAAVWKEPQTVPVHQQSPSSSTVSTETVFAKTSPRNLASVPSTQGSSSGQPQSKATKRVIESPGFLGLTSFSSTLNPCRHADGTSMPQELDVDGTHDINHDPGQIAMGVNVLKLLPKRKTCLTLLDRYIESTADLGLIKTTIRTILESLNTLYGLCQEEPQSSAVLEKVSEDITRNGQEPLVFHEDDFLGWMEAFTGRNTRWETIGIFFCALAYGLVAMPEKYFGEFADAFPHQDRRQSLLSLQEACYSCAQLCKHSTNVLVCHLLYKNLILETVLNGDSSLNVWRLHHDLVAVASAIGLHCYAGTTEVTVRSEMTKRLAACCFWTDKDMALFTGRPPAWSRRYHSCPLPLDLSDEALLEGGERLQQEIDSLDSNGWNTAGKVYDSSICRSMVLSAVILDEILELFIGNTEQWSMERVNALKVKNMETLGTIPFISGVSKESMLECGSDWLMRRLMFTRMHYLRISFLLERLSSERGNESKQNLVDVAREIVDLMLFLWLERDRWTTGHQDYGYILMCYGMPSAGILCTELLRYVKRPETSDLTLPCSEIVQSLSLMIGFMEWVRPSDGNYKLCCRMAKVIRRVLDQVFEPPIPQGNQNSHENDLTAEELEAVFPPLDALDDFAWLSSIDWGCGPYMETL